MLRYSNNTECADIQAGAFVPICLVGLLSSSIKPSTASQIVQNHQEHGRPTLLYGALPCDRVAYNDAHLAWHAWQITRV